MTPEKVEDMTIANALAIAALTEVSEQTSKAVDKTARDVDKVIKHLQDSKPVHGEIDLMNLKVQRLEKLHKESTDILHPVITALQYPKWVAAALIGLYAMSLSPVRDSFVSIIIKILGG